MDLKGYFGITDSKGESSWFTVDNQGNITIGNNLYILGNVGIGTTAPIGPLDIQSPGNVMMRILATENYNAYIKFDRTYSGRNVSLIYTHVGTLSATNPDWYIGIPGGTTDYRIWHYSSDIGNQWVATFQASGNAGFGTTVPSEIVHAVGRGLFTEGVRVRSDVADYGGGFATYTPPTGYSGLIITAADTNATTPGQRIYAYVNGAWHYVDLT